MWTVTWKLKVTMQCPLRCRYCYEFARLGTSGGMEPGRWASVVRRVRAHHRTVTRRTGRPGRSFIVWHGGEPLTLRPAYVDDVLRCQHDILGQALTHDDVVNVVQTGLYSLTREWLALFQRHRLHAAVSFDVAPGVRLTAGGRSTEARVSANLDRLLAAGVPVTAGVVLGRHTVDRLPQIHDFYAERGIAFRINPLLPAPTAPGVADLQPSDEAVVDGLTTLVSHWVRTGMVIPIEPLTTWLQEALLRRLGTDPCDMVGDAAEEIVVQPDGSSARRTKPNLWPEPVAVRMRSRIDCQLARWGFDPRDALRSLWKTA